MYPVNAIGSCLSPLQTYALSAHEAESPLFPAPEDPNPVAMLDPRNAHDPAEEQRRIMHFISHIDAACFISLLQIVDPMPDDERRRAEYRRYYHQLREVLETPPPPPEPQPAGVPIDLLR
jgi:hypothetical protein